MYKSFQVKNFRCFEDLTITNLKRVNLIGGTNNVGKTALLEALFLHLGAYNLELVLRLNAFRGIEPVIKLGTDFWVETPWDSLFKGFDTQRTIELIGENTKTGYWHLRFKVVREPRELAKIGQSIRHDLEGLESTSLGLEAAQVLALEYQGESQSGQHYMVLDSHGLKIQPIPPPPPFPGFFLPARTRTPLVEDATRFSRLEITGRQELLLNALQIIEPKIRRLSVVVVGGVPTIYGDIGLEQQRLIPLPIMGEGIARLTSLVLAIGNASGGVVLIDEIENGFHHSVLPKLWLVIAEAAQQFNTQVFATTHSLECIRAAHKAFSDGKSEYDFCLYRLERRNEVTQVIAYDQDTLEEALKVGLEVR